MSQPKPKTRASARRKRSHAEISGPSTSTSGASTDVNPPSTSSETSPELEHTEPAQPEEKKKRLEEEFEDRCPVCLDEPLHPVTLECKHLYCYLCAKGLTESYNSICSLCREPISRDYLMKSNQLERSLSELQETSSLTADDDTCPEDSSKTQWFYEGRNGWWKFDARTNKDLEEAFEDKKSNIELLICGHLYVIDFTQMIQFRKGHGMGRKRKLKRDMVTAQCKGVAGLVSKK